MVFLLNTKKEFAIMKVLLMKVMMFCLDRRLA